MRIGYISGVLSLCISANAYALYPDSLKVSLPEVVVTNNYMSGRNRAEAVPVEVIGQEFLREFHSGSLMQTLGKLPGIQSMDIGSGFSKPVIRGMGFNRVAVTENGIRQEGQQWGADHGLEIDAFNVERVEVRKGPASLQYGSDAMGGVLEIKQLPPPLDNQLFGEVNLLGKTNNNLLGGSAMLGIKKDSWYIQTRFTEQHFGDYRVPTDSIVYLTRQIPIYNRRMKNTAGIERDASASVSYRKSTYQGQLFLSNAYQKVGFFPGAHGIPDASRVEDDGNSRDIDLPYSKVNHFKAQFRQQLTLGKNLVEWNLGYQNNRREERSLFHTHYGNQQAPVINPDLELQFTLNTFSSAMKWTFLQHENWKHTGGIDFQYQKNEIGGYGFLLPRYQRETAGSYYMASFNPTGVLSFSGGVRFDYGHIDIKPFEDIYLESYLQQRGYSEETIRFYKQRSFETDRSFANYAASVGVVYTPSDKHTAKINIGRSFRLPGANELASNGVHHGTFRHEQGDATLDSEQGWQLDMGYTFHGNSFRFELSPFVSWFTNYIYLQPTGEWSILPHAGQIYRYTGVEALFTGGEISGEVDILHDLTLAVSGEYVYTYNLEAHTALSFSPPASVRSNLSYHPGETRFYLEHEYIAAQNRIARNEDPTPGAQLFNAGASFSIPWKKNKLEVTISANNLFDTRYYNHLSFYRKIEIPEPGRNFQLLIKIPFKTLLK